MVRKIAQSIMSDSRVSFRAQNQPHWRILMRMGPMLACVVQIQVHLSGISVREFTELQIFCGARRYVASEPWTADFRPPHVNGRNIIQSEATQKGEECDVVPPVLLRNGPTNLAGRQSFGLHLEVDFRIDIRGVQ